MIAMPSEDRRWRNKLKAGHDRTSVGSTTTATSSTDGEDVGGEEPEAPFSDSPLRSVRRFLLRREFTSSLWLRIGD